MQHNQVVCSARTCCIPAFGRAAAHRLQPCQVVPPLLQRSELPRLAAQRLLRRAPAALGQLRVEAQLPHLLRQILELGRGLHELWRLGADFFADGSLDLQVHHRFVILTVQNGKGVLNSVAC